MARTAAAKHVGILALGTFIILLGAIIAAVGAFRSVMHDPKTKGPYLAADSVNTALNRRHYVALISYFPEIFDCGKVEDIYNTATSDAELVFVNADVSQAATFYCWRESGDAVWLYAFGFVILFTYLVLAFIAAFRRSGHQAALGGVAFSVVIITWAFLVIVHFQEHNNIPRALNAFANCGAFAATAARANFDPWMPANTIVGRADFGLEVINNFNPSIAGVTGANGAALGNRAFYYSRRGGSDTFDEAAFGTAAAATAAFPTDVTPNVVATGSGISTYAPTYFVNFNRSPARIFGPTPRRAWLCNDDWTYDTTLRITQNLVYGGIATVLLGGIVVLVAFAYLAHPILGVVKAADVQFQRASNLAADVDYTVEYYEYDETA